MAAVRAGRSQRAVARAFGVALATVQLWVRRAGTGRLDRVDWSDRSSTPHRLTRTSLDLEDLVLEMRTELRERSDLGEDGAAAIRRELERLGAGGWRLPSERTINRILARRGLLDAVRRTRRPAPPVGWYLPDVAAWTAEVDSFDIVDGLYLRGQPELGILTAISLHGGLPAWPAFGMRAAQVLPAIVGHWCDVGQPTYAQFDSDARFIGGYRHPDSVGSIIRLASRSASCRSSRRRRRPASRPRSRRTTGAGRRRSGPLPRPRAARPRGALRRVHRCPPTPAGRPPSRPPRPRRSLAADPPDLAAPPAGRLVFLRRTTEAGRVSILNRWYPVDRRWPHRLVRCELDLDDGRIRFFALRRREPTAQPLLADIAYEPPARWYR